MKSTQEYRDALLKTQERQAKALEEIASMMLPLTLLVVMGIGAVFSIILNH